MNINLAVINRPIRDGKTVSIQDEIDEHREVMRRAGYPLADEVALVSEDQSLLPGSYQVWLAVDQQITCDCGECPDWVYVNPDGVVLRASQPLRA